MSTFDVELIESKIDRAEAGSIAVNTEIGGGIRIMQMSELFDLSKMMAISGPAVPPWLRRNPGGCLAISIRAMRWGFDPFFVAEKSYLVNNRGQEAIAFEAQLLTAVVLAHAPLDGRLRCRYEGEGDDLKCLVYGKPKGERELLECETPTLGQRKATLGYNDKGNERQQALRGRSKATALVFRIAGMVPSLLSRSPRRLL